MDMSTLEPGHVTFLREMPRKVEALGMHGMTDIVNALMVALLTGGHVLLEGNPGLGKTALVRALSEALGLGRSAVGRIQFTPDLMPADITGTLMPAEDGSGRLVFTPGPVFCSLLLADEINRATAKTQSAMLEAMAEYQVTVLGRTHPLRQWRDDHGCDYRTPFMVMATQNPIDQDGTYALPEAQSDRFMFRINMAMPGAEVIGQIITKGLSMEAPKLAPSLPEDPVSVSRAMQQLHDISDAVHTVPLQDLVATHIGNILQATNGNYSELKSISPARAKALQALVDGRITYPLGPRAAIALARATIGWSAVALVSPDQAAYGTSSHAPQALAEMLVPVLRHRLRIEYSYDALATARSEAEQLDGFLRELAVAAAPDGPDSGNYPADFAHAVERARQTIRL